MKAASPQVVTHEFALRWGSERGFDQYDLYLDEINEKRRELGLAPFAIETANGKPHTMPALAEAMTKAGVRVAPPEPAPPAPAPAPAKADSSPALSVVMQRPDIARTSAGLREVLFRELEDVRAGRSDMHRARAVASLAAQIISSVRMEIEFASKVAQGGDVEMNKPLELVK